MSGFNIEDCWLVRVTENRSDFLSIEHLEVIIVNKKHILLLLIISAGCMGKAAERVQPVSGCTQLAQKEYRWCYEIWTLVCREVGQVFSVADNEQVKFMYDTTI